LLLREKDEVCVSLMKMLEYIRGKKDQKLVQIEAETLHKNIPVLFLILIFRLKNRRIIRRMI
jgi:hypothetical protein